MAKKAKITGYTYTEEAILRPRMCTSPSGEDVGVGGSFTTLPDPPTIGRNIREANQEELHYFYGLGCFGHLIVPPVTDKAEEPEESEEGTNVYSEEH